jgi:predicted hydrocarbon binding protein
MPSTLFERFMLNNQIAFTDGSIYLMKNRKILVDTRVLANIILTIEDLDNVSYKIYNSIKEDFFSGAAKDMGHNFSFSFNDYFKWLTNIAMLEGWGKFSWKDLNEEKKSGIILVEDSALANILKGKAKKPVDHFIRGFIAGGASASLKADIDVVETECHALGSDKCVFIFKKTEEIDREKFIGQLEPKE